MWGSNSDIPQRFEDSDDIFELSNTFCSMLDILNSE
jgi:hypothetical protein